MHTLMIITTSALVLFISFGLILITAFAVPSIRKKFITGANRIQAEAIVLSINKKQSYPNNHLQVVLQMQIEPDKGRNFIAEINQVMSVTDFENLSEGKRINVMYNPSNLKEVILQPQS